MSESTMVDRYRLLREVGRGGMATVYLARDEKHQREVAVKILRPDLAAVVGPERFLREIEITARLNHPHILPLLDSGAENGLLYYVMPYVAGGSLRLLLSAGEIPLEAVTRVTREVGAALDHAHDRGVIHRDIKPENILFNEGLAVVSDFGIARAVSDAHHQGMTGTGLSIGTLGYMSPEQALGTAELDERSDVYSLGCVAFEMLVGETPASWPGAEDVELGRFTDLPAGQRDELDGYPGRIEQVLVKGLALRPQHRYGSPGAFGAALTEASERTERFSDEEVRRLLRRAAELQAEAPAPAPGDLTMGHVEQIAAQVGIPPAHVRDAARELERGPSREPAVPDPPPAGSVEVEPRSSRWQLGGLDGSTLRPKWDRLLATRSVEGEVPVEAFPAMVATIQEQLGMVGHASILGRGLTWSPADPSEDSRKLVIHVAAGDGRTTVQVREQLGLLGARKFAPPAGGVFGAAFGAAVGQALAVADPVQGVLILACAAGGLFTAIRSVVGIDANQRAPEIDQLAESLADIGRTALGPGASDSTSKAGE